MTRKILFNGASEFNHYQVVDLVYDGRPSRLLFAGDNTPQSGEAHDSQPELLFDYNQRFLEIALSLRPRRVLVIGGGTFTLPKALVQRLPGVRVDVVEIDPLLPKLAQRFFALPDSRRLRTIVADGRRYIESSRQRYDLIIIDAFSNYDIPRSLLTRQAAEQYARLLTASGQVAINFISRYHTTKPQLAHQLAATFATAFAETVFYPADHEYDRRAEQNLIMVASQQSGVQFDYLQSSAVRLLRDPIKTDVLTDT